MMTYEKQFDNRSNYRFITSYVNRILFERVAEKEKSWKKIVVIYVKSFICGKFKCTKTQEIFKEKRKGKEAETNF